MIPRTTRSVTIDDPVYERHCSSASLAICVQFTLESYTRTLVHAFKHRSLTISFVVADWKAISDPHDGDHTYQELVDGAVARI